MSADRNHGPLILFPEYTDRQVDKMILLSCIVQSFTISPLYRLAQHYYAQLTLRFIYNLFTVTTKSSPPHVAMLQRERASSDSVTNCA